MTDRDKSKAQLIEELGEMRQRLSQLEARRAEKGDVEEAVRASAARYHAVVGCQTELICRYLPDGARTTERKQVEESLQGAASYSPSLIEASLDPSVTISLDGRITDVNAVMEEITGYSRDELIGTDFADCFAAPQKARDGCERAFKEGAVKDCELEILDREGHVTPVMCNASVYRDHRGEIAGLLAAARDNSERKLAEDLLRIRLDLLEFSATHSLEELLQRTLDEIGRLAESPIGFYHFISEDEKTIYLQMWSTRTMKEFCQAEGKGEHYPVDRAGVWVDCVRERKPLIHNDYSSLPHRKGMPEGHAAVIRELVVPIMRSDRIVAILGIGNKPTDYTQKDVEIVSYLADVAWEIVLRKQAEEGLIRSEERYRSLVENIGLGISLISRDFNISMVNTTMGKWLDTPVSEFVGKKCFRSFERREAVCSHCPGVRTMSTGQPADFETQGVNEDGTRRDVRIRAFPTWGQDGEAMGFIEVVEDITERKRTEESLRESEQQYRTLFEDSIDGVYSVLRDGTITDANPAFCRLFGYTTEEIIGKDISELHLHPVDLQRFRKEVEKSGFVKDYEIKFQKRDGTEIDCLVSSSVHFGKHGNINGYRGIIRDLTARKALHRQLLQAQKMESLGTMAGGIAHDFNNLLTIILGYSDLLLESKTEVDPDYEDLRKIMATAEKGADLVRGILTFSRKVESQRRPVDLNSEVKQCRNLLERTIPKMIAIDMHLADDLKRIHADSAQIEQVLLNLAVNAQHAMEEGGTLTLETKNVTLDEDYCRIHLDAEPGQYVVLSVSDTGYGMEKEVLEHIFEPFYTTKETGKGTGLGLAMVYGIIRGHEGRISCYSEPGHGTTFKMYFPAIEKETELIKAAREEPIKGGAETILLVDDEEFVRELGKRILSASGYRVLTAENGQKALEVYRGQKDGISLVILDLVMPKMGGKECLEELLKIDPAARVLVASGFSPNGGTKDSAEAGAKGFVEKPFRVAQLLQMVRNTLDEK